MLVLILFSHQGARDPTVGGVFVCVSCSGSGRLCLPAASGDRNKFNTVIIRLANSEIAKTDGRVRALHGGRGCMLPHVITTQQHG